MRRVAGEADDAGGSGRQGVVNKRFPAPLSMGRKGTPLDWRPYEAACRAVLGQVPVGRLTTAQLDALGFTAAADDAKKKGRPR